MTGTTQVIVSCCCRLFDFRTAIGVASLAFLLGLGDHFVRGSVTVARVLFGAARAVLSRFFEAGGRYFWWWIISWLGRSWLLLLRFDFGLGFQASALNNQP